ncbi:MAG: beta-phosphoglucomutase [Planctomycetes bacterium GWF2_41_51]|nr:MAG: beta-phosphoglucomutase [Planctomycetes bacterium GWF2_41_51]HBG26477.1 beta-phosphoglucomutase [Phycisphaerales bacterium]
MIKAVIFDLDGVLLSTDQLHYKAWKHVADLHEIPFSQEDNHMLRGVSRQECAKLILNKTGDQYCEDFKNEFARIKNEYYQTLLDHLSNEDVAPAIIILIRQLKGMDIKIAIASASCNAVKIIKKTRIDGYIDVLIDGTQVVKSKPDPEIFLKAAQKLNIDVDKCVVIEDSPVGIEAARRAGMKFIAIGERRLHPNVEKVFSELAIASADEIIQF